MLDITDHAVPSVELSAFAAARPGIWRCSMITWLRTEVITVAAVTFADLRAFTYVP